MANYTETEKRKAWNKCSEVQGRNPDDWRKDICGALIKYDQYRTDDEFSWDIDHIIPRAMFEDDGKPDIPENRIAMHKGNNDSKKDDFPVFTASIVGTEKFQNVRSERRLYLPPNILKELLKIDPFLGTKPFVIKDVSIPIRITLYSWLQSHRREMEKIYGAEVIYDLIGDEDDNAKYLDYHYYFD